MNRPTILVTGATGKTGGAVVQQLRAMDWPVRAMARVRDARTEHLERLGAEVVLADIFDPDQLAQALRGVRRAYYVPPIHPYAIQSAVAFAAAAREARLESIVQLGQWLSHRAHPSPMTRQTWLMDQLFANLPGITHTTLNPGMFADNFLRVIDFAALLGVFPVLMADSRCAPVSNEDIARTAVAVLRDPERHSGMTYRPTGPRLLSGEDMARIAAAAVGHGVRPVKLPLGMFLKVARQQRIDPFLISSLRHYIEDNKNGAFSFEGGVTSVVEDLTGQPAETFETTARRYAALPFARQTLGNRVRALVRFGLTPFYPGYDLARVDRRLGFPIPPNPTFSIEDDRWRREHGAMMARQPVVTPHGPMKLVAVDA